MIASLEKGEVQVGVVWDFNGLNYRDQIDKTRFEVLIPSDGSITSGYTTIINKYAKHPNAAKLAREYIFSDAGQINPARGYARPIRAEHLTLPDDVKAAAAGRAVQERAPDRRSGGSGTERQSAAAPVAGKRHYVYAAVS